jgi:hypothetical protein
LTKIYSPIWDASLPDIKKGYTENERFFTCLLCGMQYEKGIVYTENGVFYDAERYTRVHIEKVHGSVFDYLLSVDKRQNGLSEHQSSLLKLFYTGKSDEDIQREMGIGSASTIRAHRFSLREKERQAKIFVVLMELLKDKNDRDKIAAQELPDEQLQKLHEEKILKRYFEDDRLKTFDVKEKNRRVIIRSVSKRFEPDRLYSEAEVNSILAGVFDDYAALRDGLIDYGFMLRKPDGSQYWRSTNASVPPSTTADVKPAAETQGGVYQIRNTINGKIMVISTPNLKTRYGRFIELQQGRHRNKKLQEEWNQYGENAFVFEILESIEETGNIEEELGRLERKWLVKLAPFGEKGYN